MQTRFDLLAPVTLTLNDDLDIQTWRY